MVDEQNNIERLAARLGELLTKRGLQLAIAESCTGGWIAQAVTAIPGSSEWFDRGFVTYSNLAKQDMLGVSPQTLTRHGAVSAETVSEMVQGALGHSRAQVAVAVSGIAGPGGGTLDKPVGTVWLAWMMKGGTPQTARQHFLGSRQAVRQQAVVTALQGLIDILARHGR